MSNGSNMNRVPDGAADAFLADAAGLGARSAAVPGAATGFPGTWPFPTAPSGAAYPLTGPPAFSAPPGANMPNVYAPTPISNGGPMGGGRGTGAAVASPFHQSRISADPERMYAMSVSRLSALTLDRPIDCSF